MIRPRFNIRTIIVLMVVTAVTVTGAAHGWDSIEWFLFITAQSLIVVALTLLSWQFRSWYVILATIACIIDLCVMAITRIGKANLAEMAPSGYPISDSTFLYCLYSCGYWGSLLARLLLVLAAIGCIGSFARADRKKE